MKQNLLLALILLFFVSCGNINNANENLKENAQREEVRAKPDKSELLRQRQEENYRKLHEQPKKRYSMPNDFMVAVLNNPGFNLFDFITVLELNSNNTQFLCESEYKQSNFIHNAMENRYGLYDDETFHLVYIRVSSAWNTFKEVENTDCSYDGMGQYFYKSSMFDTRQSRQCPNPELKRKLSIVPLENN